MFPDGKNFSAVANEDGDILAAACVGTHVKATFKSPGDAAFAPVVEIKNNTGTIIEFVEDDTIGVAFGYEGMSVWVLTGTKHGNSFASDFISGDDYATWLEVT